MISVCMATHNGEKFIKEQLDSILCQLAPDDEVVISDDGSTDRTLEIISAYKDSRIKIYNYKQPTKSKYTHLYVTRNFENSLRHATGEIIFLSDQDDRWLPNKVSECLFKLKSCDLVIHNLRIADNSLNDIGKNIYERGFVFHDYFICKCAYYGCAMAFKRHLLDIVLPFPSNLLVHDIWIGLLAESFGRVLYVDEPLIQYRMLPESASHSVKSNIIHKISYRLYMLTHLFYRVLRFKCNCSVNPVIVV